MMTGAEPEMETLDIEVAKFSDAPVPPPSPEAELIGSRSLSTIERWRPRPPVLLARTDSPELEPLELAAHGITVIVAGHRVRVVMDMVFANTTTSELSGTLMIDLPDRASPAYLGMFQGQGPEGLSDDPSRLSDLLPPAEQAAVETLLERRLNLPSRWEGPGTVVSWGELLPAVVVEPVRGRQVYEAVTRRKVDPALAEWTGTGAYSARIYPVPAESYKRVVFAYDQTVVPVEDRLVFPIPVTPGAAGVTRLTVHEVGSPFASSTLVTAREEIASERSQYGRIWRLAGEANRFQDAVYEASLRTPAVLSLVGSDRDVPGTLATVVLEPQLPRRAMVSTTGRALFLLDTSYSSRGAMGDLSGQMLRRVLREDDSLTEFAIVAFDVGAALLTSGYVQNTQDVREHYLEQVGQIRLDGATSMVGLLDYLEANTEIIEQADTVFLLSDGQITWGVESLAGLLDRRDEILDKRWICYSFGSAPVNRGLFEALTRKGGQIVQIGQAQDLSDAARAHRYPVSRLEAVRSMTQSEIVVAGDPELIYPGQALEVAVRTLRPGTDLRLLLRIDGRDSEVRVLLQPNPLTQELGARAWADVFVGGLLADADDASIRAIVALSRHFSLTNEFASFIILETDEEYRQYGIETRPLDFREIRLTLSQRREGPAEQNLIIGGLEVPGDLEDRWAGMVRGLNTLPPTAVWDLSPSPSVVWSPRVLLTTPRQTRTTDTTTDAYATAQALFDLSQYGGDSDDLKPEPELHLAHALRTLSAISELGPRDDQALRLTGFVLLEWGLFREAEHIFSRVRTRRPFEPQNLLLEAMAQSAQGLLGAAALRYEIVLSRPFPRFTEFAHPTATRLYADLLRTAIRSYPQHPQNALWRERLAELATDEQELPAGRLLLFWNIDDTDVDLHVREGLFSKVWYGNMRSLSGGRLFWDNTSGLGPELYEHPKLSGSGFRVSVDYFGSSSVEGAAPATTLVASFSSRRGDQPYRADWHTTVLAGVDSGRIEIMPVWRRPR
jgi:hypothetical protein